MTRVPIDEQVAILMHGSEFGDAELKAFMSDALRERLEQVTNEGRGLRVYCGYDVSGPDLHLGHTVTLRKLRQFQDLGHDVTIVIGTFTTLIGDASDQDSIRTIRPLEDVQRDARAYAQQTFRVLDRERTTIKFNHEWLGKLSFKDMIELASLFTVQQFLARDNFRKRHEGGDAILLREFLYPLAQGYDAVELRTDVQLGATEQLFNLMAGRKLQEHFGQPPQVCLTLPILVGTDGTMRMSKSRGNYIAIADEPKDKYGKLMSLPDHAMGSYVDLLTRWPLDEKLDFRQTLAVGTMHPMEAKQKLAWEIVTSFDGNEAADAAAAHFTRVHQLGEVPEKMPEFAFSKNINIVDLLDKAGLCRSKSEARRLIEQGGVKLDGVPIREFDAVVAPGEAILQVGKRRFVRILPGD